MILKANKRTIAYVIFFETWLIRTHYYFLYFYTIICILFQCVEEFSKNLEHSSATSDYLKMNINDHKLINISYKQNSGKINFFNWNLIIFYL